MFPGERVECLPRNSRRSTLALRLLPLILITGFVGGHEQAAAQTTRDPWVAPSAQLALRRVSRTQDTMILRSHAEAGKPFTVAGPCGAIVGQQDGSFEAWIFPVKVLSGMRIEARVDGYDVPIDVNRDAAEVEVAFDHTTITYSTLLLRCRKRYLPHGARSRRARGYWPYSKCMLCGR